MRLTVLTVPECPHGPVLNERLAEVLADHPGTSVTRQVITDERQAATTGMHGSPTLLVDGIDPFADAPARTSLSCRMYRDTDGSLTGAPSTAAIRHALRRSHAAPNPAARAEP